MNASPSYFTCTTEYLNHSGFLKLVVHTSGETTRKGFYVYNEKRKANPDPEVKKYIEKARKMAGITVDPKVGLPPYLYMCVLYIRAYINVCVCDFIVEI